MHRSDRRSVKKMELGEEAELVDDQGSAGGENEFRGEKLLTDEQIQLLAEHDPQMLSQMVPSVKRLIISGAIAGLLPAVAYHFIRPYVNSNSEGLEAIMAFPLGYVIVERIRNKNFDPIGLIAIVGIGIGLLGTFLTNGGTLSLKIRDCFITTLGALLCFGSLLWKRPAMFYMARAFAAEGDPEKKAQFDQMWFIPGVAHRFRVITSVWAFGFLLTASIKVVMALTLTTQQFLNFTQLNFLIIAGLIVYSVRFSNKGQAETKSLIEAHLPAAEAQS